MNIRIYQADPDDLYIVEGLDSLCFGSSDDQATREEYDRAIWWIAYDGDTPIGYTGAYVHDSTYMALDRSGVLPAYRGKGLQKRLIQTRLKYARRHKISTIYTYASSANHASVNNLVSQGFKTYTPEWAHAGEHPTDGCIFIYFMKILQYS